MNGLTLLFHETQACAHVHAHTYTHMCLQPLPQALFKLPHPKGYTAGPSQGPSNVFTLSSKPKKSMEISSREVAQGVH
jgi:hypothetical protein